MGKRDKLRRKLRNNPRGVKFSDLETLLLRFGFRRVRVQGSHHVFEYKQGDQEGIVVVPSHRNDVRFQYVMDALDVLDELFPEAEEDKDDDE